MVIRLSDSHPFPLQALAFNFFDHSAVSSPRVTSTGVSYDLLTYEPLNTQGFDYDRFFTHSGSGSGTITYTYSFTATVAEARAGFLSAGVEDFTRELTTPRFLNAAEQANARAALSEVSSFAAIQFVEVTGFADINYFQDPRFGSDGFARSDLTATWSPGGEYLVSDIIGMVVIGTANDPFFFRHELGHVLALKHVGPFQFPSEAPFLPAQYWDSKYTIMYYDVTHPDLSDPGERVNVHFQLFDVYALQQRFGANLQWRTGDDVYTAASFDGNRQVLWDAGGVDTLDFSAQSLNQVLNLNAGTFSTLGGFFPPSDNLSIAFGATLENAVGGSGNDRVLGNSSRNNIAGGAGNDTIEGGANADTIQGGLGNDTLDGGTAFDTVDYSDRTDGGVNVNVINGVALTGGFVNAAGFYQGGAQEDTIVNLENINGTNFADRLIAGSTSARIEGRGGNDFLFTFSGNDTLFGGEGNDFLSTANSTDRLFGENGNDTLNGGTGFDTLDGGANTDTADYSDRTGGVSVNLINNVALTGGALNASGFYAGGFTEDQLVSIENIIGTNFGDRLVGLSAGSRLDGRGGNDNLSGLSGADTLIGGAGNDALAGGAGSDTFEFAAGFGADRLTDFVEGAGAGDVIRLVGLGAAFDSFAEVIAAASQSGGDVVFNFGGGNTITVLNATVAGFAANDFAFG